MSNDKTDRDAKADRNSVLDARGKPRVQTVNNMESRTVQSDVNKADIRAILRKHGQTGIVDHLANVDLAYRDVSEFTDFRDIRIQLAEAETAFYQLDPRLREVFNNDPNEWLDVAHEEEIPDEYWTKLEKLGIERPVVETAPEEPVETPPADTAE